MCIGPEVAAAYPTLAAMFSSGGATAAGAGAAGVGAGLAASGAAGATAAGLTAAELAALEAAAGTAATAAPVTEGLISAAAPVTELSTQAGLMDSARIGLQGLLQGGGGSQAKTMLGMQGLKMMMPEQQQQRPGPAMPMQGQQGPLPTMYGEREGPYGTSAGNSLGIRPPMTEEQKRKLRERGLLGV